MTLTPRHKLLIAAALSLAESHKHEFFLEVREFGDYRRDEDEDWLIDELVEIAELLAESVIAE